ncbi:hypothetical protein [Actinacidiphila acididurans]|uniref:Uncharacterized protein n=1 Tax=Actinacidiphila acididurans TaxID=2784346 RepID=A0ABS2TSW0_9ACTN|nr:hypothetical protein [Actinacidiphila acididurans]MBM9506432.1 hypothetical protein [Actinacidiphila acididurans]
MDTSNQPSAAGRPLPARPVLPDTAAARGRGPADTVDARWQSLALIWQWRREVHEIRRPGTP